ncbi:M14 family zinc carboxypeptidase [Peredibacter sp. HCB2-198]|uniref:M14 family zinc carboxypeptidase n=1 Tax=Peredibacter sp. HCB2-198 TaxID=3383025 RepID=UPI0038B59F38
MFKSLFIYLMTLSFAYAQTTAEGLKPETKIEPERPVAPITFPMNDEVQKVCKELDKKFAEYKWGETHCQYFEWINVRKSNAGTPLIWTTFGIEDSPAAANTTLVLCGVHGDEITPVKFCWDLMRELKSNHSFNDKMVVVAPLVSPDSFFKAKPTRTNAAGVDVNRNFPTADWKKEALKRWKDHYKRDKRKYPGPKAASEQETIFQMNLVKRYRPNKIITVHAPLTILDYDGPSLKGSEGQSAKQLLEQMSQKSQGYKISNYPIFPGSLGNWAGKENRIPTYTLELPNTVPTETDRFWQLFGDAVIYAIEHKMKPPID